MVFVLGMVMVNDKWERRLLCGPTMRCVGSPKLAQSSQPPFACRVASLTFLLLAGWSAIGGPSAATAADVPTAVTKQLTQFCFDCHSDTHAEAGVNLERMSTRGTFAEDFRTWRKVIRQLEEQTMPPADSEPPDADLRHRLIADLRRGMDQAAQRAAGTPGTIVIRRLTSAEYGYTIHDLTGLDLDFENGFVSDAVGGAGFTNTGIAQFIEDATLERYLETAKRIADHAVIGTGPLAFFRDPGATGLELSAISRIEQIYREHGFRTAAGEGGKPFGLEKYPKAFFVAWLYEHRETLGRGRETIESVAMSEAVQPRFAKYIHDLLTSDVASFPTSEIIAGWRSLPPAVRGDARHMATVRRKCDDIASGLSDWQLRFGTNVDAKEEAPVLRADRFRVSTSQAFEMNINWPAGTETAHLVLSVESAHRQGRPDAVIIWREPKIQFRDFDQRLEDPQPLQQALSATVAQRLRFGWHPRGGKVGGHDFVTVGTAPPPFEIPIPPGARSARLLVTAELDIATGEDCIVRCQIAQLEETDQGKSVAGLLANPDNATFAAWRDGVLEFARLLPQVSHQEPAPSDRDPIPPPLDNSYNNPERNHFHTRVKYHRDDQFIVDHMLDDETRRRLDEAWCDLLGSFEYHDAWLQMLAKKFDLELGSRGIDDLDDAWIARLPDRYRPYIQSLRRKYQTVQTNFAAARPGHVDDVVRFAALAWRRPLSSPEADRLRVFYEQLREQSERSHEAAIRALLTRVLVAPQFLYRAERGATDQATRPLSEWELASRLSYLLWSSVPDAELRRHAASGQLADSETLAKQTRRMLRHQYSRRFAAEFFGQWFGFYRFDQYRGIDPQRFPEFSDSLKSALYDEAVSFFDYIVRNDRPAREILFADYTFLNSELARHYEIPVAALPTEQPDALRKLDGAMRFHRGGLLRLGAVLTVTSAPLRTSPVKRGDWILRRTLGTPVPPPPADAGSIAADDLADDGLSLRQRLEAHRREVSCKNCHSRIDALGFALENYDPLGRWRQAYRDGTRIDTSGILRDGTKLTDDQSLHTYLGHQQRLFHQTLAANLLAYALGRQETIGDLPLLREMADRLADGASVGDMVETIALSPQFRHHGGSPDKQARIEQ